MAIGGLPFLPVHTDLVEQLLDDLILASPETAHELAGETAGTEQYYEERFARRSVLVGVVASKEHLEYHLRTKTYHISVKMFPKGFTDIEHVALYEPEGASEDGFKGIRWWGRVAESQLIDRWEIPVGSRRGGWTEQYLCFAIEGWEEVVPIRPAGYGVRQRLYTAPYLLTRAGLLPELSLMSEVEMRVWRELRGRFKTPALECAFHVKKDGTYMMMIDGRELLVAGENVLLGRTVLGTVTQLRVRPRQVVNAILRAMSHTSPGC